MSPPSTAPEAGEQERMVEALLFASAAPLTTAGLRARLPEGCDVPAALARLERHYAARGVRLVRAGDGWALRTAPDLAPLFARDAPPPRRLSSAAMETLAVIAYHQPATRAEVEAVRGVAVSRGVVEQLLGQGWIAFGRRREAPGRPATFVTTRGFLDHFGLASTQDLPSLEEMRAAGLLDGDHPDAAGAGAAFEDRDRPDG